MNRSISMVVLGCLVVLVPGASAVADGDAAGAGAANEYTGTWAQLRVQSAVTHLPVVGDTKVRSIAILRIEAQQAGREITGTAEMCRVEEEDETSMVDTVIPEALWKAFGRLRVNASLRGEGAERTFFMGRHFTVLGARLEDLEDEALPTSADDSRVTDADGDGHPGVTIRITGFVNGEVYLLQRTWAILRGKTAGLDRIDGTIQWGEERVSLGASSPLLGSLPETRPDPDASASYFRTTRIEASMTCADILAARDRLFAR